jgi:hypothetical protein
MRTKIIVVIASLFVAASLFADVRGVYLGGGVGQSFIKTDVKDIEDKDWKLDDNDFAYTFIAGVRMSNALAIEGGYKYLGSVKDKFEGFSYESKISGYDLCAVGNVYLGIVDIYGKAGLLWWDKAFEENGEDDTDNGSDLMWGFGATVRLGSIGLRAEWERFEVKHYDRLSMLSVGLIFGL